jgi:Domain of unknown function (DUF397)
MTTDHDRLAGAIWRKASRSATNGDCVEIAHGTGVFGMRDSKNPDGCRLVLSAAAWAGFLADTKSQQAL